MGTLNSGRPGGNPDFGTKYKFARSGDEPITSHLQVKVTQSMKERLDKLGKNKAEWIRDKLEKALASENL